MSTSGKGINLKPKTLGTKEVCYYQISAGTPEEMKIRDERPVDDQYLTMTFIGIQNTKVSIIIGESLTSDFVD